MSLWTDRELKVLMKRVDDLEARVRELEAPKAQPEFTITPEYGQPPAVDKRTKAYRQWKSAT